MKHRFPAALLLSAVCCLGGCSFISGLFGWGGENASQGRTIASQFDGLKNKSLGIVIYAPSATLHEYTGTREELTYFITAQMQLHLPTTHLLARDEVITWQNEHLNWTAITPRDIGRHFSVERVLYVELLDYSTRKVIERGNMQGHIRAQCKIVNAEDSGTDAPEWTGLIDVSWPPDGPLDPTQTNDSAIRQRVLESFSRCLVECFYDGTSYGTDIPG
jgi:hypothetical protein